MIGALVKLLVRRRVRKAARSFRDRVRAAQRGEPLPAPWTGPPPGLVALGTALVVGPLAYRLGRRAAAGTLFEPGTPPPARVPGRPGGPLEISVEAIRRTP